MMVPPAPEDWRLIPSWQWLRAGVEGRRSRVVITAASRAGALERTLQLTDSAEIERRLRSLPGVGVWTAAEVRQRAHGDADAFSFADYHVSRNVSYALTGEELDDEGTAELIEPYRGHRFRVQRLLELSGPGHPRYGPRKALPTHTPGATHRLR
jgi:3-methyladenine DNA glycosylase/8-oxoguanine DNA glycosylase